jgi:hypothetical protein
MKTKREKKTKSGITLIEVLLYTTLFTIFTVLVMPVFADLTIWRESQRNQSRSVSEYLFIKNYVNHLAENAQEILTPSSGQSSGKFTVRMMSGEEVAIQMSDNISGNLVVLIDDHLPAMLHSSSLRITAPVFYRHIEDGLEKIDFSLSVNGKEFGTSSSIIQNK